MNSQQYDHDAYEEFTDFLEDLPEKPRRITDRHIGQILTDPYRKTQKFRNYKPGDFRWKLREAHLNIDRKPYRITFRVCEECRADGVAEHVRCVGCDTRDAHTVMFFTIENKKKLQSKRFRRS